MENVFHKSKVASQEKEGHRKKKINTEEAKGLPRVRVDTKLNNLGKQIECLPSEESLGLLTALEESDQYIVFLWNKGQVQYNTLGSLNRIPLLQCNLLYMQMSAGPLCIALWELGLGELVPPTTPYLGLSSGSFIVLTYVLVNNLF